MSLANNAANVESSTLTDADPNTEEAINPQALAVKKAQEKNAPIIAKSLAAFINQCAGPEVDALTGFRNFLLDIYDPLLSGCTFHKATPGPYDEQARELVYSLLRFTNWSAVEALAASIVAHLYDAYGSNSQGVLAGVPSVNYAKVFESLERGLRLHSGLARQNFTQCSQQVSRFLDCIEHPERQH